MELAYLTREFVVLVRSSHNGPREYSELQKSNNKLAYAFSNKKKNDVKIIAWSERLDLLQFQRYTRVKADLEQKP